MAGVGRPMGIALALAAACLLIWLAQSASSREGALAVSVTASGREVFSERLVEAEGEVLAFGGPLGITEVEISGGRVRVLESPCPDRICVKTGWISRSGEVIACVPNRLVVTLKRYP